MPTEFSRPGGYARQGLSPQTRASDADRDRVADVLRIAAGDGRLTAEEFDERLGAALSARTFGDLTELTSDLIPVPAASSAAIQPAEVVRIDQRGGSVRLSGNWAVPRLLELRPSWCDVTLDFTEAAILHDTLRIEAKMRGGSLVLITGPGIVIDAGTLSVRYTDVDLGPSRRPDRQVILRVELAGRMKYGHVETRWHD